MLMAQQNKVSVYGGFGFVLGEFCRQFPDISVRVPKEQLEPITPLILYGVSTTDNYNVFDNPTLDIETNLIHLMEVLDACHKKYGNKFEFIYTSSWFVYGRSEFPMVENFPIHEEAPCHPTGFYSITKYSAEMLLQSYCETFKIPYRILRLANVLGHRDRNVSKKKNALQFLIDKLVHNEDIELYDGGKFYRDYIDVRDAARAIRLVMESGTEPVYNISNGTSHLFKDLIDHAVKYSGTKGNVWEMVQKPEFHSVVQSKDIFLSNEKLKKLGYEPKYKIQETIEEIINEYMGDVDGDK